MINSKDKQEGQGPRMDHEYEELQQATQLFMRSMFRTGVRLALLPVNLLPQKPQQHFQAAGREFTYGLATLVHELADGVEKMANDAHASTHSKMANGAHASTHSGESSDTNEKLE